MPIRVKNDVEILTLLHLLNDSPACDNNSNSFLKTLYQNYFCKQICSNGENLTSVHIFDVEDCCKAFSHGKKLLYMSLTIHKKTIKATKRLKKSQLIPDQFFFIFFLCFRPLTDKMDFSMPFCRNRMIVPLFFGNFILYKKIIVAIISQQKKKLKCLIYN